MLGSGGEGTHRRYMAKKGIICRGGRATQEMHTRKQRLKQI